MKKMNVEFEFFEEVLGGTPGDPNIAKSFVISKSPDALSMEQEIELIGVDEVIEKGKTIFPKEDNKPFVWDYQIKGMMKDYCSMLRRVPGTKSKDIKAYNKIIDGLIFVYPRKIFYAIPPGLMIGTCQRPLRAKTMQGERVTLAISETIPPESKIKFELQLLDDSLEKVIIEWLDYGSIRGFGQWRNSGKGKFLWKTI